MFFSSACPCCVVGACQTCPNGEGRQGACWLPSSSLCMFTGARPHPSVWWHCLPQSLPPSPTSCVSVTFHFLLNRVGGTFSRLGSLECLAIAGIRASMACNLSTVSPCSHCKHTPIRMHPLHLQNAAGLRPSAAALSG
jgi:hypothetical protein